MKARAATVKVPKGSAHGKKEAEGRGGTEEEVGTHKGRRNSHLFLTALVRNACI
jgi:hypothetical protein